MINKIVVRTVTELSYAGEYIKDSINNCAKGILLKPSPNSELMVWFPIEEIQCVITPEGKVIQNEDLETFCK